ncbi:MAG: Trk family potassium uptake protein, partial [Christensenellales bacterium]
MKEKREAPMSPSLMIAIGFALLILLVTLLLMLPISSQSRTVTPPLTALFTATSAVCVTGQVLVDTGMHWSLFGQVVLIAAIQIGGLGVSTLPLVSGMGKTGLRRGRFCGERLLQCRGIVR